MKNDIYALTRTAFQIYYYCTLKDRTRAIDLGNKVLVPLLGRDRSQIFRAKQELIDFGYLKKTSDSDMFILTQ